jgi:hypothetical protein
MISHHTKNKGDLGVLKAQLDLYVKGWLTLIPATEHAPFDLVAWKDGKFKTIQVKYRELVNGCVGIKLSSSWADKNGSHVAPMNKELVDLVCVYCPETDKCYYLNPKDFDKSVTLRVEAPKQQIYSKKTNYASDYVDIYD